MSKRNDAHIKEIELELLAMRSAGCTRQEIADRFGLEKNQIKNWINRYNRAQNRISAGLPPKHRGFPKKDVSPASIAEYRYEINLLKMENQLLRDFLKSVGRV